MFDISWTEFLLIAVVALVVIGPKELPGVLRTLGQWTRKLRRMAADFQNQFQEAMREAEMTDLKKQVDDIAQDFRNINPLKSVRDDIEAIGKDIGSSPDRKSGPGPSPSAASAANGQPLMVASPAPEPVTSSAVTNAQAANESPIPEIPAKPRDKDIAGVAPGDAVDVTLPHTSERTG
jgi:sec-independent protein translocase protein TatB